MIQLKFFYQTVFFLHSSNFCSFELTALHWAIASSNTNAVPPLLKAGASLDATNSKGQTPSDLADERKNNYIRHKLKEENIKRGVGSPGFLKSILSDRVSYSKYYFIEVVYNFLNCVYCESSTGINRWV